MSPETVAKVAAVVAPSAHDEIGPSTVHAMRAIVVRDFGAEPELVDVPARRPGPAELWVRVHASSVNGFDLSVISGSVSDWMQYELPITLGRDFAGVVEAVGERVSRYGEGDEVFGCYFPMFLRDGAWAEQLIVPEDMFVAPKPRSLDFGEAAALPLAGIAALQAVEGLGSIEGERVLVVGATGGVGGYAVQLLRARGAHVIATTTPQDDARLRALGAESTLDFTSADIVTLVQEQVPGRLSALVDTVSDPPTMARLAAVMADGARIATTTGSANVETLAERKICVTNVFATPEPETLARLASYADAGDLRPPVERVYALQEARQAIAHFRAGTHGKLVVAMPCTTV